MDCVCADIAAGVDLTLRQWKGRKMLSAAEVNDRLLDFRLMVMAVHSTHASPPQDSDAPFEPEPAGPGGSPVA